MRIYDDSFKVRLDTLEIGDYFYYDKLEGEYDPFWKIVYMKYGGSTRRYVYDIAQSRFYEYPTKGLQEEGYTGIFTGEEMVEKYETVEFNIHALEDEVYMASVYNVDIKNLLMANGVLHMAGMYYTGERYGDVKYMVNLSTDEMFVMPDTDDEYLGFMSFSNVDMYLTREDEVPADDTRLDRIPDNMTAVPGLALFNAAGMMVGYLEGTVATIYKGAAKAGEELFYKSGNSAGYLADDKQSLKPEPFTPIPEEGDPNAKIIFYNPDSEVGGYVSNDGKLTVLKVYKTIYYEKDGKTYIPNDGYPVTDATGNVIGFYNLRGNDMIIDDYAKGTYIYQVKNQSEAEVETSDIRFKFMTYPGKYAGFVTNSGRIYTFKSVVTSPSGIQTYTPSKELREKIGYAFYDNTRKIVGYLHTDKTSYWKGADTLTPYHPEPDPEEDIPNAKFYFYDDTGKTMIGYQSTNGVTFIFEQDPVYDKNGTLYTPPGTALFDKNGNMIGYYYKADNYTILNELVVKATITSSPNYTNVKAYIFDKDYNRVGYVDSVTGEVSILTNSLPAKGISICDKSGTVIGKIGVPIYNNDRDFFGYVHPNASMMFTDSSMIDPKADPDPDIPGASRYYYNNSGTCIAYQVDKDIILTDYGSAPVYDGAGNVLDLPGNYLLDKNGTLVGFRSSKYGSFVDENIKTINKINNPVLENVSIYIYKENGNAVGYFDRNEKLYIYNSSGIPSNIPIYNRYRKVIDRFGVAIFTRTMQLIGYIHNNGAAMFVNLDDIEPDDVPGAKAYYYTIYKVRIAYLSSDNIVKPLKVIKIYDINGNQVTRPGYALHDINGDLTGYTNDTVELHDMTPKKATVGDPDAEAERFKLYTEDLSTTVGQLNNDGSVIIYNRSYVNGTNVYKKNSDDAFDKLGTELFNAYKQFACYVNPDLKYFISPRFTDEY